MNINIKKLREELRLEFCADINYFGYGRYCNDKNKCDWCRSVNRVLRKFTR